MTTFILKDLFTNTVKSNCGYQVISAITWMPCGIVLQVKEQPAVKIIKPAPDKPDQQTEISDNTNIDELTKETVVVAYVKQNNHLPDYYITKKEARKKGWNPAKGNLCEVLPGNAIGGDIFTNREGSLPEKTGRKWYEADLNYDCAHRNADRLLFSNDGLVFVTKDHYKTFVEK